MGGISVLVLVFRVVPACKFVFLGCVDLDEERVDCKHAGGARVGPRQSSVNNNMQPVQWNIYCNEIDCRAALKLPHSLIVPSSTILEHRRNT